MLKVVHLQAATFSAGRAAFRLHTAFLEEDISSSILSLWNDVNDTELMNSLNLTSSIFAWIDKKMQAFINRDNNKQY